MNTALVICICICVALAIVGLFSTIIFSTLLKAKQEETKEYRIWAGNIWGATMAYLDKWIDKMCELD